MRPPDFVFTNGKIFGAREPADSVAVAAGRIAAEGRLGGPPPARHDGVAFERAGSGGRTMVVGAPAAIAARWLADGFISRPGVHPPETIVPPQEFYRELVRRGPETILTEETILA
ncbi:MAG: hypothetical protein ACE5MI_07035 [Acidimicrobiia bacterium]